MSPEPIVVIGVTAVCGAIRYYQNQQLKPLSDVRSSTEETAKPAAAAFISFRFDYCNSLLYS